MSLKGKFSLFIAALLICTIGLLSGFILKGVSGYQREQLEQEMAKRTEAAAARITQQYVTGTRVDSRTFIQLQGPNLAMELGATTGIRVTLYDNDGLKSGDSMPMAADVNAADALQLALRNNIAYVTEGDTLDYFAPLQGPDELIGVIHFQTSLSAQHAFYRHIVILLLVVGLSVLAVGLAIGLFYMNRQASAITKLKLSTDRIRQGDFLHNADLQRYDELGELSQGIDAMRLSIHLNVEALHKEKANMFSALQRLQLLEQQQKQFIGNVSHELKTPLTTIKAYAELLFLYKDDPALIQDSSEIIIKESDRLHDMLENILRLSAMEKYEFNHQPERVDLKFLLADISTRMKGKADKLGLTLLTDLQPANVWADRESLVHIFVNLLDNALKYNRPKGSVTISTRIVGEAVEIAFCDTGVGIPLELRSRIFEPFYTVNRDRARQSGGSGLGLALVKQFVDKQNGTITVRDNGKFGTCFVVTLPLA
ncbi:sensor histidine kinase [Paenibacillus ferrarius]|nr:HAMP domain-containing sensor histidine kinase [Paenibacillus ferrarius]